MAKAVTSSYDTQYAGDEGRRLIRTDYCGAVLDPAKNPPDKLPMTQELRKINAYYELGLAREWNFTWKGPQWVRSEIVVAVPGEPVTTSETT